MRDHRRVRFSDIAGIPRCDLPLAGDIWLDDLMTQKWTTREVLKLATVFVRYMSNPTPDGLQLDIIEGCCQLDRQQVAETLRLMQMYRAIEAFSFHKGVLRVSLTLTLTQRLKTLEAKARFTELQYSTPTRSRQMSKTNESRWIPSNPLEPDDDLVSAAPDQT